MPTGLGLAPPRTRPAGMLAVAAAIVAGVAIGRQHSGIWPSQCVPPADTNLLVVTLDTTRADAIGAYGNQEAQTPTLDRLAREGVLFETASSVAPLTLPAHASLFTGRLPARHGARENAGRLDDAQTTLAERLRGRGFETAAFVSAVVLSGRSGIAQGFDTYVDGPGEVGRQSVRRLRRLPGDVIADEAVGWLARRGPHPSRPFFAWVHFYDAHAPYQPPEPFWSQFPDDAYAGSVAFTDAQVGRLLAELERQRLLDRTIVVVIGDHGEGLGEHGEQTHGLFLYESVLRVPFIVRAPCVGAGTRVGDVVRSTDVMPTVLDLLAVTPAPPGIDGTSLVPMLRGAPPGVDLEAYADNVYPRSRFGWSELRSLRSGRFKLIVTARPELYDLELDPKEQRDLLHERPRLAEGLLKRVGEIDAEGAPVDVSSQPSPDPTQDEIAAGLAALGYAARSQHTMREPGGTRPGVALLPDPKDNVATFNRLTTPRGWQP